MKLSLLLLFFVSSFAFSQTPNPAIISSDSPENSLCSRKEIILTASPQNGSFTYRWFRDGKEVFYSNLSTFTINQKGVYYVKITGKDFEGKSEEITINDCSISKPIEIPVDEPNLKEQSFEARQKELVSNFNTFSKNYTINASQGFPQLVSTNPVICGTNTSTTLSVTNAEPTFTYAWLYATSSSGSFAALSNETNATLTTSTTGYYKVFISDGTGNVTLGPLYVGTTPYGIISDAADNAFGTINTTVGQTVQLKFKLFGIGPWTISYYDGSNPKSITTNTSPFYLNVSPTQNRSFNINSISNSCGSSSSGSSGQVRVVVDATTTINLTTPTNTTVCPGGTVELPFTTTGTWDTERRIYLELTNTTNTNTYTGNGIYFSSPMVFQIPSGLSAGTYKIRATVYLPYVLMPVVSTYNINVAGAVCQPSAFVTVSSSNVGCSGVFLYATPSSSDYSFQWNFNGNPISGANSNSYFAGQSGNYSVTITKPSIGYSSTSNAQLITINPLVAKITSNNPSICGNNTSATLNASPTGVGYTYQWYMASTSGNYLPISGATQASYTTTVVGNFYVNINNGSCSSNSNSYNTVSGAKAILTDMNDNLYSTIMTTAGQPVQLKMYLYGGTAWTFSYFDGSNTKTVSTATSPYILTVNPEQNRQYSARGVSGNCSNTGSSTGYVLINVDATTTLNLTTPSSLTACAGGSISIPYTTVGTWTNERNVNLELTDANGNYLNNIYSYISENASNPIIYNLPETLPTGTYRIRAGATIPYLNSSKLSTYSINVNSTGCSPTAIFTTSPSNVVCSSTTLTAYPFSSTSSYSYQWYLNGNAIANQTGRNYFPSQTGNYYVKVTRPSTGYDQTSAQQAITINGFTTSISSANPVICGTNTTAVLSSNLSGGDYTYQWLFSANNSTYLSINGETNQSITVSAIGYYKVLVKQISSNCEALSSSFNVGSSPYGVISDQNDNQNATINISNGQSTDLKLKLYGQAPWVVKYFDGSQTRQINVTASPYNLQVTPNQNRRYYISSVSNDCGIGTNNLGSINVIVDNSTSLILDTPASTNICAGGTIDLPYTTIGTWTSERSLSVAFEGTNTSTYFGNVLFTNPLRVTVPANFALNSTYKIRVYSSLPYISNSVLSNYTLTVTNTGCNASANINIGSNTNEQCGEISLYAGPSFTGNVYTWYRDANLVGTATSSGLTVSTSGNYSVVISNTSSGYNSTSIAYPINVKMPTARISSSNTLCDINSSITMNATPTGGSYTYEWFYSGNGNNFSKVMNQNSSSLTANNPGFYYVVVNDGACQSISGSYRTCPILMNFQNTTVCQQSGVSVSFSSNYYSPGITYTLQLLDATTNAILNGNLATIAGSTSTSNYTFNFNLPSDIGAGTYKFKIKSDSPIIESIGTGILTVSNAIASTPPTLSANPTSVTTAGQNSTLTASNCNGTVVWSNGFTGTSQIVAISSTITYTAYCTQNTCNSPLSSVIITYNCDQLEPNNDYTGPTLISTNTYQSIDVCLDSGTDKDYFAWIYNGKIYYILVRPFSTSSIGTYKLSVILNNGILTAETKPIVTGNNLDTYLILYDSNGTTQLIADDDSGEGNYSLLNYTLPTNPCPSSLNMYASLFDILSGQTSVPKASQITATNKLNNDSNTNFRAENAIFLNPGFETKISTSGVFKAEIKGCSDNN